MERWKDSIARALETSELKPFTAAAASLTQPERSDDSKAVADVDIEERKPSEQPNPKPEPTPDSVRERVPKYTHKKPRHVVKVKGRTIDFRHEFAPLGEREAWYRWTLAEDGGGIDIYTNTEFPAYFTTHDKAFYATIHIVESIAQLLVREADSGAEELEDIKELLLRKAAAVKDQWVEEE